MMRQASCVKPPALPKRTQGLPASPPNRPAPPAAASLNKTSWTACARTRRQSLGDLEMRKCSTYSDAATTCSSNASFSTNSMVDFCRPALSLGGAGAFSVVVQSAEGSACASLSGGSFSPPNRTFRSASVAVTSQVAITHGCHPTHVLGRNRLSVPSLSMQAQPLSRRPDISPSASTACGTNVSMTSFSKIPSDLVECPQLGMSPNDPQIVRKSATLRKELGLDEAASIRMAMFHASRQNTKFWKLVQAIRRLRKGVHVQKFSREGKLQKRTLTVDNGNLSVDGGSSFFRSNNTVTLSQVSSVQLLTQNTLAGLGDNKTSSMPDVFKGTSSPKNLQTSNGTLSGALSDLFQKNSSGLNLPSTDRRPRCRSDFGVCTLSTPQQVSPMSTASSGVVDLYETGASDLDYEGAEMGPKVVVRLQCAQAKTFDFLFPDEESASHFFDVAQLHRGVGSGVHDYAGLSNLASGCSADSGHHCGGGETLSCQNSSL